MFTTKDTVNWSAAAGATSYYLYRGGLVDLPNLLNASIDSCERGTTAGLSMSGLGDPVAGLEWYLVRAHNAVGYGSPGNATAGPRVQDVGGICP